MVDAREETFRRRANEIRDLMTAYATLDAAAREALSTFKSADSKLKKGKLTDTEEFSAVLALPRHVLPVLDKVSGEELGKGFFEHVHSNFLDFLRSSIGEESLKDLIRSGNLRVKYPVELDEHVGIQAKGPLLYTLGLYLASVRSASELSDVFRRRVWRKSGEVISELFGIPHDAWPAEPPSDMHAAAASVVATNYDLVEPWLVQWFRRHNLAPEDVAALAGHYVFAKISPQDSPEVTKRVSKLFLLVKQYPELTALHPKMLEALANYWTSNKRVPISKQKPGKVISSLMSRRGEIAKFSPSDIRRFIRAVSAIHKGDPYIYAIGHLANSSLRLDHLLHVLRTSSDDVLAENLRVLLKRGSLDALSREYSYSNLLNVDLPLHGAQKFSKIRGEQAGMVAERMLSFAGIRPESSPRAFLGIALSLKKYPELVELLSDESNLRALLSFPRIQRILSDAASRKDPGTAIVRLISELRERAPIVKSLRIRYPSQRKVSTLDPFLDAIERHPALELVRKRARSISQKKDAARLLRDALGGDVSKLSSHAALKRAARIIAEKLPAGGATVADSRAGADASTSASPSVPNRRQYEYYVSGAVAAVAKLHSLLADSDISIDASGNLSFNLSRILSKHHDVLHALKAVEYLHSLGKFKYITADKRIIIPAEEIPRFLNALDTLSKGAKGGYARIVSEFSSRLKRTVKGS